MWAKILEQLQPGDFVIIQFGHNDAANSQNYTDRISLKGSGDETQEIASPKSGQKETVHTYGWYLRQYVEDAKAKGATPSFARRSRATLGPTAKSNAVSTATRSGLPRLLKPATPCSSISIPSPPSVTTRSAKDTATYFADNQHTTKAGARLNAEAVVEGLKQLKNCPLAGDLVVARSRGLNRPDPKEIPVPPIKTSMGTMPGVNDLPVRNEMPDVLTMNDGTKVTTVEQWKKRREEMKRILEYYAVGLAPPPPGNVKGQEINSQLVMDGKVKYRLVHLTFGPEESLSLDIGIFTPTTGGPFPALISPSGSPPGATPLAAIATRAGTRSRSRCTVGSRTGATA